jgi:hypothetical protein
MKIWCFLPVIFLIFTACEDPVIHSLPEPELEVLSIVFTAAEYQTGTGPLVLKFDQTYGYDGIFGTYNQETSFAIGDYLRAQNLSVKKTQYYNDRLEISLAEPGTCPEKIVFNQGKPCYFYKTKRYGSTKHAILEAKAFIGTSELTVIVLP